MTYFLIFIANCLLITLHTKSFPNIYLYKYNFFYKSLNNIPKPYLYTDICLKSNVELINVISEIDRLLPQLAGFITQFNDFVNETGINVFTDVAGNMSIDVPTNMSDSAVTKVHNKIGVIDRLINNHGTSLNDLFKQGANIEQRLKANDPQYISKLGDQIKAFKELNASYKH
jgi:hypothetical protein